MEVRLDALQKEWKAGRFKPAYYFLGETLAVSEAAKELEAALKADAFNVSRFPDSEAAAAVADALTPPAFGLRRLVVIDSPKLSAGAKAELARYLENPLDSTTLVLLSDEKKVDPKDPIARLATVCVLGALTEAEAQRRLAEEARGQGKALSPDAAQLLVEEAGTDWPLLRQELEKALLFAKEEKTVEREHILSCLGYQKSADPFALPRLVQKRDLKACLLQLRRLFAQGKTEDVAFRALSQVTQAVSKQFRAKTMEKAGVPAPEIFRTLRLHPYWDRDYLVELKRFALGRLRRDLERCLEAETALKSKAWLDSRIEVESLVVSVCGGYLAAAKAS